MLKKIIHTSKRVHILGSEVDCCLLQIVLKMELLMFYTDFHSSAAWLRHHTTTNNKVNKLKYKNIKNKKIE
jgi:hypothetical protein